MNEIREYARKQISSALHLLEQNNVVSYEEMLHQLRVNLKKIKAVLDYLRTLHPKKIKSLRKKLQIVFHAAGSIREAQLRLKWVKGERFNYLFQHAALDQEIKKQEDLFFTQKEDYHKQLTFFGTELDEYLKEVEEKGLLDYVLHLKERVKKLLLDVAKKDWHVLRKLIKQLLYAYHWLTGQDKLKVLAVADYKKLNRLQEKIGLWHDAEDLLQWLRDGQFFPDEDDPLKQQFNQALIFFQKDIEVKENIVIKQLHEQQNRPIEND